MKNAERTQHIVWAVDQTAGNTFPDNCWRLLRKAKREESSTWLNKMTDYDKTKWYQLYAQAMIELEHALMAGRIMDARSEILLRLEILRDIPGLHAPERQAIQDALSGLRSLEREEIRFTDEKHKEVARLALERLRSIGPIIELLNASDAPDQN